MSAHIPEKLMTLIRQGEGLTVEFKKSTTDIPGFTPEQSLNL